MSLTTEQQAALTEYYRCLSALGDSVLANGEDIGNDDVAKHNSAAAAAYALCRKLRISSEYGIATPRMVTVVQSIDWPSLERLPRRKHLGSFFSVESAEDKLGWHFVHNCCFIEDF